MTTPEPQTTNTEKPARIYPRPDVSDAEITQCTRMAGQVLSLPRMQVVRVLTTILTENMRLTKEVNEHRAVHGFAPLKEFKVK